MNDAGKETEDLKDIRRRGKLKRVKKKKGVKGTLPLAQGTIPFNIKVSSLTITPLHGEG